MLSAKKAAEKGSSNAPPPNRNFPVSHSQVLSPLLYSQQQLEKSSKVGEGVSCLVGKVALPPPPPHPPPGIPPPQKCKGRGAPRGMPQQQKLCEKTRMDSPKQQVATARKKRKAGEICQFQFIVCLAGKAR